MRSCRWRQGWFSPCARLGVQIVTARGILAATKRSSGPLPSGLPRAGSSCRSGARGGWGSNDYHKSS